MTMFACPRCRAAGSHVMVVLNDGYGICPECDWVWQRGDSGQMVHIG